MTAYYSAEAMFGLQKRVSDWMQANFTINPKELGQTVMGAESVFFQQWHALRLNGFTPPAKDSTVSMEGALDNMANKLHAWRHQQMGETQGIYNAWVQKVRAFGDTRQATYEFYDEVTQMISNERKTHEPAEFNSRWMADALQQIKTTHKELADSSLLAFSKIGNVSIYSLVDLTVASMACGPEVEAGNNGVTIVDNRNAFTKVYDWVTMKPDSATSTVDNQTGWAAHFIPPMITEPKPVGSNACDYSQSLPLPGLDHSARPQIFTVPKSAISDESRTQDLGYYSRLLLTDYIRRDIRPSVVEADGTNHFPEWWKNYVEPQVIQAQRQLQREYVKGVVGSFYNDLTKTGFECYGLTSFDSRQYGNLLSEWDRPDLCKGAPYQRYLPHGLFESLRMQAHLYFNFLREVTTDAPNMNPLAKPVKDQPVQPILITDNVPTLDVKDPNELKAGDVTITPQMLTKGEFLKRVDTLERIYRSMLVTEKILKSNPDPNSGANKDQARLKNQTYMVKKLLSVVNTHNNPVLEYKKKLALSSFNVIEQLEVELSLYYSMMTDAILPDLVTE